MSISRDSFSGERALLSSRPRVSYSKDTLTPEQKPSYRHQWKGVIFSYCKVKGKSFFCRTNWFSSSYQTISEVQCNPQCVIFFAMDSRMFQISFGWKVYQFVCILCVYAFNRLTLIIFLSLKKMYFTPIWLGLLHITHCKCWYLATNQIFADIIAPTSWKLCLAWGGSASKRRTLP